MNPVVHFEMPYKDRERMAAFYTKAFGWKSQMLGPEMENYVVVQTGETDANQMLVKPGMINGGFFAQTEPAQHPSIVIQVDDIRAAMQKVAEAGGIILSGQKPDEPDEIPGIGLYCRFTDSEGNVTSMLQPHRA